MCDLHGITQEISIHAPLAGCDRRRTGIPCTAFHFNPRTPCGVRHHGRRIAAGENNFNPRTPCGVRPKRPRGRHRKQRFQSTHPLRGATPIGVTAVLRLVISIHAPLAGCDDRPRQVVGVCGYFNPRTPCGVRPAQLNAETSARQFQSTHPLRGATVDNGTPKAVSIISIHAPLAGCDSYCTMPSLQDVYFNPRTPCGVRRS